VYWFQIFVFSFEIQEFLYLILQKYVLILFLNKFQVERNMLLCENCNFQGKLMRNLLFFLVLCISLQSCDDGDVIVTTFDFEDAALNVCGDESQYVFFKINNNAQESISLQITPETPLFLESGTRNFELNGSTNIVNYRRYDGNVTNDYFCNAVPPTTPTANIDYVGASGTASINTTAVYNDNDGLENETGDTDGDGIPNSYDYDDDGDNVPTAAELDTLDEDGDGDPLTNPLDTDGDGTPDYLDPDDDGDTVLTRNEDRDQDLNPQNDLNGTGENEAIPDYLNNQVTQETIVEEYREHTYSINSDVVIRLSNLVLVNGAEQITQQTLLLGDINDVLTGTITEKPSFVTPDGN